MNQHLIRCTGCGGSFPQRGQLPITHPYIGSTTECWQSYGKVLAKEFNDEAYFKVHRITVDTYAAQHVGDQTDRRARQSANLHLIALYLMFEKEASQKEILKFLDKTTHIKRDWQAIPQKENPNWMTIKDVQKASDSKSHEVLVKKWGESVWQEYKDLHENLIHRYHSLI